MAMTVARIPNEVIAQIVSHITDRSDLLNLRLVSRSVQHEAERAIYRTLDYDVMSSQLKETLRDRSSPRCQRIAPLVREFVIEVVSDESYPDLRCILENLFNIHTLYLYSHFIGNLLRGCSFRLQMLHGTVPCDADWLQFLQTQPELIKLTWYDMGPESSIESDIRLPIFPNLRVLGGSAAVTRLLLPTHHSITNIFLSSPAGIGASRFLRIQSLGLGQSFVPRHFPNLANQFPNLRYLNVTILRSRSHVDLNGVTEDLVACIDRLKHLEKLKVVINFITTTEKEVLVSKLMGWHPRLRTVEIIQGFGDLADEWQSLSWTNDTDHAY